MSIYPSHSATAPATNAGDADLLLRIGIALALRQRPAGMGLSAGMRCVSAYSTASSGSPASCRRSTIGN